MDTAKLDYKTTNTPENYKCCKCNARGVQLLHQYTIRADGVELHCRECIAQECGKPVEALLDDKLSGWWVASIPTPECDTFWGPSNAPREAAWWFICLPAYKSEPAEKRKARIEERVTFSLKLAQRCLEVAQHEKNDADIEKWIGAQERLCAIRAKNNEEM